MYATRVDVMVAFGKAEAFEQRAARQLEVVQALPGFQARRILNSLGCPAKYTMLSYWDSREAARAATRSAAMLAFIERDPTPEWGTIVRPVEAYEEVHTVQGRAAAPGETPAQVTLFEWTLNPGVETAEAFEQSRAQYFALQQEHNPGLYRMRLLRYLGGGNRYLVVVASTGREAMLAAFKQPEIARFLQAHPSGTYGPAPAMEICEPVRVAVPV